LPPSPVAGLPSFTVSIGVVEASPDEDFPSAVARADAALFQAKHEGRDQVVIKDAAGNTLWPDATIDELDAALDQPNQRHDPRTDRVIID